MTFTTRPLPPHPDLSPLAAAPPPLRVLSLERDGRAVAQVGLWEGPSWAGQRTGLIGTPALLDGADLPALLEAACAELRSLGAKVALGPLNGSTWFSYRVVTDPGTRPPFLLEPQTSPVELAGWEAAGFTPRLGYHSAVATPATHPPDPRAEELARRFADVTRRSPTLSEPRLSADLRALHALSLAAFAGNPLYSPLPLAAFEGLYRPLLGRVPLDWVWLVERGEELVGFVFAYPDPGSGALVLKTLAVRPGRAEAGLGRHLSNLFHARAFAAGVPEVVHALMWDGNESAALSASRGEVIRRYALLGREL
ncbi:MAG: GNAT family N-acetyltransferase [Deinococcus sp.]|nr:GNAT family N-acetyltransferase [Deinococcus sp.]